MSGRLHRRALIKSLAAAGVSLPLLPSLYTGRRAAAATSPKRLVIMFSPIGTIRKDWLPSGSGKNFTLSSTLQPLSAIKKKLLILDGVDNEASYHGPKGGAHPKGMASILTGRPVSAGNDFITGGNNPIGWGAGISVDQLIAQKLHKKPFSSLAFGVVTESGTVYSRMSYTGPAKPVQPEDSPYKGFDRLFSGVSSGSSSDKAKLAALRARRKSVLDMVRGRLKQLEAELDAADRKQLEAHLAGVRSIEQRLDGSIQVGASCTKPKLSGSAINYKSRANLAQIGKLQMDLLASALICNLTPVATLQWHRATSGMRYPWIGVTEKHHKISHKQVTTTVRNQLLKISNWYAKQFAYLARKLDAVREGTGTVLDNTVILWVTEVTEGKSHTRRNLPLVMAGSCGGYFETGRFLEYDGKPHNDLLVSLCQAMGVKVSTFGTAAYCNGPLPKLRA